MDKKKVIIASNNKHKVEEIKAILENFPYDILTLKDAGIDIDVEENGITFEENAYIKAKAIMDISGDITLADDSGLEVYALDNAPGVYSARFAGEHGNDEKNNKKLLQCLKDVPDEKRGARFVSAIAMLFPDGGKIIVRGYCEGKIGYEEKGEHGFGYDPLFIVPEFNKTYSELLPEEKNAISHRGRALEKLREELNKMEQKSN